MLIELPCNKKTFIYCCVTVSFCGCFTKKKGKLFPASDCLCNLLALRAESGLLRTRLEGQEKEIVQLRKQIKHLEEKERVANESVIFFLMSNFMC